MDDKLEKLNKANYLQWSMQMRRLLELEDCLNAIEFNTSILTDKQRKEDEKCKSLLYLNVDKDNLDIIGECTTSTEIWNKLKETHTKFDGCHAILVLKEFVHLEMDQNENILEYVNRRDHLYTKVQGAGFNFENKVLMGLMLIGLPMKYEYLRKTIQIHDDSITPASLEMRLVEEERYLNGTAIGSDSIEYSEDPLKMEVDKSSNENNETQCHSNSYLPIKAEEEVEIKLEDLHHSIEIKEETSILASQPDREFKPYKCKVCNFSSACKVSLNVHLRTHTGEKPFTCEICGYKCAQQGNLNVHLRTHSGEKPFGCEFCDYKSANKGRLKSHLRIHTGEKPFSCDICDYKCAHNAALKVHLRTHTGEKPYACDICSQKFTQRVHYINHLRTHTGEKPFACEICDFRCADHGYLKIHIRAHTGAKPFTCDICNYTCAYQPNFKTHLKTHSGVKPFNCEICGYKCTRKGNLNIHLKTHTEQK